VALAERGPVACEPLIAFAPDHAPPALQLVAPVADQFNMALPPLVRIFGVALSARVGAEDLIETVAACVALPPLPVHVTV